MTIAVTAAELFICAFAMAGAVLTIGKERKPSTPGIALVAIILNALCAAGIVYLAVN